MLGPPRGRARFTAVCHSWRAAAHAGPPVTALPWLLLSPRNGRKTKTLHCLEDGAVVRLRVPSEDAKMWIIGGHDGGWVALHLPSLVRIVNLFSGAEVALDEKKATILCTSPYHSPTLRGVFSRVIFSAPPNSPLCILAAISFNCGVALCRIGCPNNGWTVQGCPRPYNGELLDIAFCKGELYGLRYKMTLTKFEVGLNEDGALMVTAEHTLLMQWIDHAGDYMNTTCYIFDLQGKLAMAVKTRWLPNIQPFFKVFELIDNRAGRHKALCKHKWLEVTSLGDIALFLGKTFSKAVLVPANVCNGVERNRIYYSHHSGGFRQNAIMPSDKVSVTISNDNNGENCYKEDDSRNGITEVDIKRIMSVGYFMKSRSHDGMWIIPPEI